jgi:NAD(P)-dependent dehydrogenase (short-subunit alcohol dehydrogenase family)
LRPTLTGQIAFVTGASSGLGREVAVKLATEGASVAVVARSREGLEETAALVEEAGGRVIATTVDVTDRAALEQSIAHAEATLGPIDLLVNNAGSPGPVAAFWETDPEEWWAAVEVNLHGPASCSRAVLPGMVERRRGRIVNVVSNAGVHRWPYLSAYATSKAAVVKLTENLAVETKKHGVKLFAVDPGMLRVGMTSELLDRDDIPPEHPAALVAAWFRGELERGREVPLAQAAELIATLAGGSADALSGCYLTVYDDLEALIHEAPAIRRNEAHLLRIRELP